MENHMQEQGPLYTSLPFVMFDEGGWVGVVVCGGEWCGDTVRDGLEQRQKEEEDKRGQRRKRNKKGNNIVVHMSLFVSLSTCRCRGRYCDVVVSSCMKMYMYT